MKTEVGGGVGVDLYSFFNLSARWWRVVNATLRRFNPREGELVLIVLEVGCALRPVQTGKDNLHPTGIRSADSPTCRESLE
jgi:hypothetical protein